MLKNDRPINHQLHFANSLSGVTNLGSSLMSIDEQIAALQNKDSDNSDTDDSESADIFNDGNYKSCTVEETDDFGNVLKLVSAIDSEEKIVPLGKEFLPGVQCSKSKKFSRQKPDSTKDITKRIRFNESDVSALDQHPGKASSGLEATVRELLRNYEPASLEKRPFYCRVCKFQGQTTDELDVHRLSEFHLMAADIERKMSFCKLCRKQFTSPDQLKEHLKGKGHVERLERMKLNNITRKKFC